MKKYSFILLSMLAATSVWAQDTVQSPLMENYYMDKVPILDSDWHIIMRPFMVTGVV